MIASWPTWALRGYEFTLANKGDGVDNVEVRLDWATCSAQFTNLFPETSVKHVATEESDRMALTAEPVQRWESDRMALTAEPVQR